VNGLLRDGTRRKAMSDRAYKLGRTMVWSNTAGLYMGSFHAAQHQGAHAPRESVVANGFGYRPQDSPDLNLVLLGQRSKFHSEPGRLPQPMPRS
jgi:hypothetical protein